MKKEVWFFLKAIFVVGLSSAILYEVYNSLGPSNKATEGYFKKNLTEVEAIKIEAGRSVNLVKNTRSKWFVKDPLLEEANTDLIESYLESIQNSKTEVISNKKNLNLAKKYGLNDPLAKISFTTKSKKSFNLSLSSIKAFNRNYYLSIQDSNQDKVLYVVSDFDWVNFILKRPVDFLKTKEVLKFEARFLKKIDLHYSQPLIKDTKTAFFKKFFYIKNKNLWRLSLGPKFDSASVNRLLDLLKEAEVSSYEGDKLLAKKNKNQILNVVFLGENGQKNTLKFYKTFKGCSGSSDTLDCQLATLATKDYPFWIERKSVLAVLNQSFLMSD